MDDKTPITDAYIAEQLALAEKATPGPLMVSGNKKGERFIVAEGKLFGYLAQLFVWEGGVIPQPSEEQQEALAAFFVAARTGYPAVLRALAEHRRVLRGFVDATESCNFDDSGWCREHLGSPCGVSVARALLGEEAT